MAKTKKRAIREPLSAERIELAALDLIEKDGLEDFSTRRLAAELGCEAMSIYHYFPSKQHLMDGLVDRVLAEISPPPPELDPIEQIRAVAIDYRRVALRFPNFHRYLAFHRLNTPGGIRFIGHVLDVVMKLGAGVETTARLFRVIGYYLGGATLDETAGYARGHSAADPVSDEVVIRDYPAVVAVNPYFKQAEHEKTFLLGLDMLLDETRRMLAGELRGEHALVAGAIQSESPRERPSGRSRLRKVSRLA